MCGRPSGVVGHLPDTCPHATLGEHDLVPAKDGGKHAGPAVVGRTGMRGVRGVVVDSCGYRAPTLTSMQL